MGTCISLHKDPDSALRFKVGAPAHDNNFDCEKKVADSGLSGSDFGSKEEVFFDSRAWIDSDCEDDFFSVKGDFTPSRGSTPVHPSSFPGTPRLNKTLIDVLPVTPSEPSPRKKLAQLLLESSANEKFGNGQMVDEISEKEAYYKTRPQKNVLPTKAMNGTPYSLDADYVETSVPIRHGGLPNGKVKNDKAMQCCLPSVHSLGIYDRKKLRTSPKHHNVVHG